MLGDRVQMIGLSALQTDALDFHPAYNGYRGNNICRANFKVPSLFSFEGEPEDDLNRNTPFLVDVGEKLAVQWARLKPSGSKNVRATFNFMRRALNRASIY